ncbi:low density lipoprotein receptor adapter protein 1-A-like [Brevipalpus obovatus]|uniref:low density lipoprotein receptor adapter protein 1-A-like n=1 Tax=Brevipalpus obovatus TaxID=246614 RepID=UPI003D9E6E90
MSSFLKAFTFGKGKHEKLSEEWGESIKEPVNEGLPFHCKYIGSTLVEKSSDDATTADAIKTIVQMAKISGRDAKKVVLTIRPSGISCKDLLNDDEIFDISIYRISYCSADANYPRVVAFIATNLNETHECHAFLTRKDDIAQACALTISQAFAIAFEKYQMAMKEKAKNGNSTSKENESPSSTTTSQSSKSQTIGASTLIDFNTEPEFVI